MSNVENEIATTTANAPAATPKTLELAGLRVVAEPPRLPAWHPVTGALVQVSVGGAAYIWGVNSKQELFQFQNGIWTKSAQKLTNVSVGADGTVWGVSAGKIFYLDGARWTTIPGSLTQISVGSASNVWGMDGQKVLRWTGDSWTAVTGGSLASVSVASDGTVWGVNTAGEAVRRMGAGWTLTGKKLKQVSVGSATKVWGVENVGGKWSIWQWNDVKWTQVSGALMNVSAAPDGTVWGVNTEGHIFYRLNAAPLVIHDPRLTETDLEPGDKAGYEFRFTNVMPGVTLSQITATLLYDEQSFSGVTVTPGLQTFEGSLETNEEGSLSFELAAGSDARIDSYGFYGVNVTYTVTPVDAAPVVSNNGGWMCFKVVPHR